MAKAIRFKVSDPAGGDSYCRASLVFDDGTVEETPIESFSELRAKAAAAGFDEEEVVIAPATVAWLRDQEGWPDSDAVGRIR